MGVPIANSIVRVSIRICALRVMVSNLAIMTNLLLLWNSALTFIWSKNIFLKILTTRYYMSLWISIIV